MQPKPEHFGTSYADAFKNLQVVEAYRYRAPYPAETFEILSALITDHPRTLLDVGTGSGDIARQCVDIVDRIDAVDVSQNMIEQGKKLPNGDHPHLHWIYGTIEEVPLSPPYALITAGSSIHWTNWEVAFPRFHDVLTPNGWLTLVHRRTLPMPWQDELATLQAQYTTHRGNRSEYVRRELEQRGLFHISGEKETAPISFTQTVDEFIEGLHSRSNCAKERIGHEATQSFDQQVRTILQRYHPDGILPLQVVGIVTWGKPQKPAR
ncbi:hypothetical protein KDA_04240 [Dictyobacter alpinus]|uniref:Methyltransferase domain-containing protein n=1 Tax=Dictyobacter alpinus TaxID=2014873 RepID=A0A402B0R5_9CHLR|nr:class I SAM-dependent methyltransferase [Dictyobacter alpinus]GCE24940.1 hypothetical protein KDA_04240 [Dictyobacter alpinus]